MISFPPAILNYPVQGTDGIENYPDSASIGEGGRCGLEDFPTIEPLSIQGEAAKKVEEKNQKIFLRNRSFITIGEARDLWFSTSRHEHIKKVYVIALDRLIKLGIIDKEASLSSFFLDKIFHQIESSKRAILRGISKTPTRTMRRSLLAFTHYLNQNGWNLRKKTVTVMPPAISEGEERGVNIGLGLDKNFWQNRSFITIGEAKDLWLSTVKHGTLRETYTVSLNKLIELGILAVQTPISLFSSGKIIHQINDSPEVQKSWVTTQPKRSMLATLAAFARYLNKKMREKISSDTSNYNPEPRIAKAVREVLFFAVQQGRLSYVPLLLEEIVIETNRAYVHTEMS